MEKHAERLGAARALIEEREETMRRDYMSEHGYKKMTAARRADYEQIIKNNTDIKRLRMIINVLQTCGGRDREYHSITEQTASAAA